MDWYHYTHSWSWSILDSNTNIDNSYTQWPVTMTMNLFRSPFNFIVMILNKPWILRSPLIFTTDLILTSFKWCLTYIDMFHVFTMFLKHTLRWYLPSGRCCWGPCLRLGELPLERRSLEFRLAKNLCRFEAKKPLTLEKAESERKNHTYIQIQRC